MKILLSLAFIFAFCAVGSGQTILTKTGKELKDVEKQIVEVKSQLKREGDSRNALISRYSNEYVGVIQSDQTIKKSGEILTALEIKKQELSKTKLAEELPNNNLQLLKMIVVQNERIIELLEKLAPKN